MLGHHCVTMNLYNGSPHYSSFTTVIHVNFIFETACTQNLFSIECMGIVLSISQMGTVPISCKKGTVY